MSYRLSDPPRWRDSAEQLDPAERRAGQAIRCIHDLPARPAPPLSRIGAQLRARHARRPSVWLLAAASLVLGAATMAWATHLDLLPTWLERMVTPRPPEPLRDQGRRPRPRAHAVAPGPTALAASPTSVPQAPPTAPASPAPARTTHGRLPDLSRPRPAQTARPPADLPSVARLEQPPVPAAAHPTAPAEPVAAAPAIANPAPVAVAGAAPTHSPAIPQAPGTRASGPAPADGHAHERPGPATTSAATRESVALHLTQAIRWLRVERDAGAALRLLDRHDHEWAMAGLTHEALLLRVEALLALGRRAELLRLLDRTSLTDVAASRALLITRGELRAEANRCAEGIADFDVVLARSRNTDRQALVGRARCRKHLGDVEGARADVERLRGMFPGQALPARLE